jgi:hypothetical protein
MEQCPTTVLYAVRMLVTSFSYGGHRSAFSILTIPPPPLRLGPHLPLCISIFQIQGSYCCHHKRWKVDLFYRL